MKKFIFPEKNWFPILLLLACSMACLNCQQAPQSDKIEITASEFAELRGNESVVVLDVRTTSEYDRGHIEEAVFMDMYKQGFREELLKMDKSSTYYIYCHSGGRSLSATKLMRQNGFKNVFNVKGGIISMSKAGIEFVK